jgi:hypothetical protein
MDAELYLRLLAQIQKGRRELEDVRGEYDSRMTQARTELAPLAEIILKKSESLQVSETALRSLVLAEYAASGQKKFPMGTEVKVFEKLVYDEAKALQWCQQGNFNAAIKHSLDRKAFEAYAKAQIIPGLTETVKEPRAMLPTKIDVDEVPAPRRVVDMPPPEREEIAIIQKGLDTPKGGA